jgi:hypothetical protein
METADERTEGGKVVEGDHNLQACLLLLLGSLHQGGEMVDMSLPCTDGKTRESSVAKSRKELDVEGH